MMRPISVEVDFTDPDRIVGVVSSAHKDRLEPYFNMFLDAAKAHERNMGQGLEVRASFGEYLLSRVETISDGTHYTFTQQVR